MAKVLTTGKRVATERFQEHEQSAVHRAACAAVAREKRTIATTFNSVQREKQRHQRQGLISHLGTMKTLLRQGIAIRGNTDSDSNIYQFNFDKAINDKGLEQLLEERHYVTSHDILDEQKRLLVLIKRPKKYAGRCT